jgi:hypothetical protein
MTEKKRRKAPAGEPAPSATAQPRNDGADAERLLGRAVSFGLPVLCVAAAVVVGFAASVGSALLVVASGALLGTIALLWTSVRTLSGDAPLPVEMESQAARSSHVDARLEQKRRVLRALKDLEAEHAIGKIDDVDYEALSMQYREEAKALMREMDETTAPAIAEAEKLAREFLAKRGLGGDAEKPASAEEGAARVSCAGCGVSNEADAAFCKKCGASLSATKTGEDGDVSRKSDGDVAS